MSMTNCNVWCSVCMAILLYFSSNGMAATNAFDELLQGCKDCHGNDGISEDETVPIIAGLSEIVIIDNLLAFKERKRPCRRMKVENGSNAGQSTDMCKIADKLAEIDIEKLSSFFSKRQFIGKKQVTDIAKAALGDKIHQRLCEKCHSENGSLASDDASILSGQWMPYLKLSFADFLTGKRYMPKKMQVKIDKLKRKHVEALLHFYARQSP